MASEMQGSLGQRPQGSAPAGVPRGPHITQSMAMRLSQEATASLSPGYSKCGPRARSIGVTLEPVEMQPLRPHPDLLSQNLHLPRSPRKWWLIQVQGALA